VTIAFCAQAAGDPELATAQSVAYREFRDHVATLAERCRLTDKRRALPSELSRGMKQKLKIAVVVVLAAGMASSGAAWKWRAATVKPGPSYKIAGWSWGNGHAHPNGRGGGGD